MEPALAPSPVVQICAKGTQFNGKEVGGRALIVNEAKPRENRNGGGGGGRY